MVETKLFLLRKIPFFNLLFLSFSKIVLGNAKTKQKMGFSPQKSELRVQKAYFSKRQHLYFFQ